VLGVYAKENNQGMLFPPEEAVDEAADENTSENKPARTEAKKPSLKVVK